MSETFEKSQLSEFFDVSSGWVSALECYVICLSFNSDILRGGGQHGKLHVN